MFISSKVFAMKLFQGINVLLCLTFHTCHCQTVSLGDLDRSKSNTSCPDELLVGDKFVYAGQMDVETSSSAVWPLIISINIRKSPSLPFTFFCDLDFRVMTCEPWKLDTGICYCESHIGTVYNFIINDTAALSISNNEIRGIWTNDLATSSRVTAIRTIPKINDAVQETIQIETVKFNPNEINDISIKYGDIMNFTYCVDNLKTGYSLTMKLNGDVLTTSISGCASTLKSTKGWSGNQTLTLIYDEVSGCIRKGNHTINITAKPPSSVDYTDTIIGVVVGVGSCLLIAGIVIAVLIYRKEKPKCSDSKIILVIVVTVAGSVVIVGIIIGLLYYFNVCKFKKANKQPTGLTLTETKTTTNVPPVRHIQTKKPLTPLAPLPPHKISPTISGNNERASNLTESNETPNDSSRRKKSKKKRARRKIENGGKNDEQ